MLEAQSCKTSESDNCNITISPPETQNGVFRSSSNYVGRERFCMVEEPCAALAPRPCKKAREPHSLSARLENPLRRGVNLVLNFCEQL